MFKKGILLTACLFLGLSLSTAQNEKAIHFGFNVSSKLAKPILEETEITDSPYRLGGSIGVDVYYDISGRIQLVSGLSYSYTQFQQQNYGILLGCDFDGNGGDVFNSWLAENIEASYLEIPLGAKFKLLGDANHLYLKTAAESLFNLGQDSYSTIHECGNTEGRRLEDSSWNVLKDYILMLNLALGGEITINETIKLIVEPHFAYSAFPVFVSNDPAPDWAFNGHQLEWGLRIGVRL